jgi:predicted house-cleaning noncanonical NTP pyrophosphatase (MazG superfamily)/predicted transcriptional regulator
VTATAAETGRDDEAVARFVERMAMVLADWGFPRMGARVLITIMAADEDSLTAAELSGRLGVSPAAISGAVRYLMHLSMIAREPVPGSRLVRYRLPNDAWYLATATKNDLFESLAALADEGVAALGGPATTAGARVADMRDYFTFATTEVPAILGRWKTVRALHSGGRRAKLVRDRIPELIEASGRRPEIDVCDDDEYAALLRAKLHEESDEYFTDPTTEELADILEVVYALARTHGIDPDELEKLRAAKAAERGGFERRLVLTLTEPDDRAMGRLS